MSWGFPFSYSIFLKSIVQLLISFVKVFYQSSSKFKCFIGFPCASVWYDRTTVIVVLFNKHKTVITVRTFYDKIIASVCWAPRIRANLPVRRSICQDPESSRMRLLISISLCSRACKNLIELTRLVRSSDRSVWATTSFSLSS